MGFIKEKKERDQSTISIAFIVGAAVFSIVWFLRSLSMALAMATAAALLTWGTSTWLQSEPRSAFQEAVSNALSRISETKYKFQEKDLIPLVVGVLAWGVSKFLVGEFLGVMVGGMVVWILHKRLEEKERLQKLEEEYWERLQELKEKERRRLQKLEEERRRLQESEEKERRRLQMLEEEERKRLQELEEKERRKKRVEEVVSGVLGFAAAAGATALAVWGMSKAFDGGPGGEDDEDGDKDEKMMKAPGRDYLMPRKDFESNPSEYFRRLRGK